MKNVLVSLLQGPNSTLCPFLHVALALWIMFFSFHYVFCLQAQEYRFSVPRETTHSGRWVFKVVFRDETVDAGKRVRISGCDGWAEASCRFFSSLFEPRRDDAGDGD